LDDDGDDDNYSAKITQISFLHFTKMNTM